MRQPRSAGLGRALQRFGVDEARQSELVNHTTCQPADGAHYSVIKQLNMFSARRSKDAAAVRACLSLVPECWSRLMGKPEIRKESVGSSSSGI